ncbi:MAG: histidine phosphatase family protein [Nanoarchaeota archaeon]|nr:histidine phosphatase family protein [Nanoarchaeota archaeon]
MKIYLVRHAEKEHEGEDANLTKKGISQANLLGKKLKKIKFDEFYCSDLNRAKQTSEIVSRKIILKSKVEKSLNEFRTKTMRKDQKYFEGEEKKHFNDLKKFLEKITKNPNSKKTILIIAHGFTNRIIFSILFNITHQKILPFIQHETGINEISYAEEYKNWRLEKWNDFNHLPNKLK